MKEQIKIILKRDVNRNKYLLTRLENAVTLEPGGVCKDQTFRVGDYLEEKQVEHLCLCHNAYKVTVNG